MKLLGEVTFQCLLILAMHLLCSHRALSQQVPEIMVNGADSDVLVSSGARVELSCESNSVALDATFFLNDQVAQFLSDDGGNVNVKLIESMSVEYQGTYKCRAVASGQLQDSLNELAIIIPPPAISLDPVIAAEGEPITLSCPLQVVPGLEMYYIIDWRYSDMIIVRSGEMPQRQWASLNENTLALTVSPYNSTLPSQFQCVSISFQRLNLLTISQSTKGIIDVIIPEPQLPCVMNMPPVVVFGDMFNVTCTCGNSTQTLYNAKYQFFHKGNLAGTSSNSSTMIRVNATGNFACSATQYSDQGTGIPSQQSPPVLAIVLEAPNLVRADVAAMSTDGCTQQVTGSLSQAQPVMMTLQYFFHSDNQPTSCENGREPPLFANVTEGQTRLDFEVNLTNSGLDTRKTVYLTGRFLMDGVVGPCSKPIPLQMTVEACPPQPPPLSIGEIAGIVAAGVIAVALVSIVIGIGIVVAIRKIKERRKHIIVKYGNPKPKSKCPIHFSAKNEYNLRDE